jgi:hypothetical protein
VQFVACIKAAEQQRLALILIAEMLLHIICSGTGRDEKKRREHDCDPDDFAAGVAHRPAF